jgi:hypothetical protein
MPTFRPTRRDRGKTRKISVRMASLLAKNRTPGRSGEENISTTLPVIELWPFIPYFITLQTKRRRQETLLGFFLAEENKRMNCLIAINARVKQEKDIN